jgi:hypothetical protein
MCCTAWRCRSPRRDRGPAGPQRHGQEHADPHACWAMWRSARAGPAVRPRHVARQAARGGAAGVAYVPEGRGIFPNLTVRENLVMAARPGRDGRPTGRFDRVLATFPRLAERLGNQGNAAVRRRAADAVHRPRADDASLADHPGRGHRGPGAADRGRDLARHRPDPPARHRHADRRPRLPQGAGAQRPRAGAAEGPGSDAGPWSANSAPARVT